jgi:hypothetical protein
MGSRRSLHGPSVNEFGAAHLASSSILFPVSVSLFRVQTPLRNPTEISEETSVRELALSERFQSLGRHCRLLSVLGKVRSFPCSLLARCSFPPAHSVAGCIRGRFLVPSGAEQSVTIVYLSDAVNQGPKSCRESGTTARGLSATLGNSVLRIRLCFPSSIEASPRASAVRRRPRVHDSNHLQLLHINP